MKEVNAFFKSLDIKENDYVVVAVSGGPDSMALLDMILKFNKNKFFNIVCAHVNHKLRLESEEEAVKVKEFCSNNDIIFEYMEIKEYNKENFHSQAHNIRYNFFESLVDKYNAEYLFTAHHGDDLMETILMRIVRGSTLRGYAGFGKISDKKNYKIVRPLVNFTKDELLNYVKENNIWYAEDLSNKKDKYTRNRFRKYIVPELKKEDKNVHLKFNKFNQDLIDASNYILKCAKNEFNIVCVDKKINIELFKKLDYIIQKHIIYIYIKKIYDGNLDNINNKHVESIMNLINSKNNTTIDLPEEYKAIKDYNSFYISKINNKTVYEYTLEDCVILPNGKKIELLKNSTDTDNNIIYLNSNDIKLPIKIRTKQIGDTISVKNMNGTKKVKDIFINSKISKEERELWPIVLDSNNNVLWIPGLKKSKFDSQKSGNYDIILKYS